MPSKASTISRRLRTVLGSSPDGRGSVNPSSAPTWTRDFASHQQQQLDDIVDKDGCHDLHPRLHIRSRVEYARCFIESASFAEKVRPEIHPKFRLDSFKLPK
jgi:hypothetical protein